MTDPLTKFEERKRARQTISEIKSLVDRLAATCGPVAPAGTELAAWCDLVRDMNVQEQAAQEQQGNSPDDWLAIASALDGFPCPVFKETSHRSMRVHGILYRRQCVDRQIPERHLAVGPLPREAYWFPNEDHRPRADGYTGRYVLQLEDERTAKALAELLRPFPEVRQKLKAAGLRGLWHRFITTYIDAPHHAAIPAIQVAQALGCWPGGKT